ncbi:MAG: type III pantothenate kinase [Oscillospiraceae bacterium]|jgi:type III pantothenate kinase|nr:type III pantothenate kinase [Oscillospiraceae bacterium]
MILAIDIGNTNIVIGAIQKQKIMFTARISTNFKRTSDEFAFIIGGILENHQINPRDMEGGIVSSVVPELKAVMQHTMEQLTRKPILVVGSGLRTGLNIRTDDPAQLGSDLVLAAVAAVAKYPKPIIVYDFGTATTLSVIDPQGNYIGGMIIPGMRLSIDALSAQAAQLPYVHLEKPQQFVGSNTVNCMQSGVVYGNAAMIDGLSARVEEFLGMPTTVVATGGLVHLVAPYCKRKLICDDHLLLDGLRILYEKNHSK